MPHDHFSKELTTNYVLYNFPNVTHLFDGKDMKIECIRKDNNLKRSIWSDEAHDSSRRTMNFTNPMGLSFELTRAVGSRPSGKKKIELWGSAMPREFPLEHFKNHF